MTAPAIAALTASVALTLGLGTASAQVPDWPSERPPRPLPAQEIKFPPYVVRTLANGLQVIAVSHHEQPVVSVRLLIRAGGAQDPDMKPGVASLLAALLDQGTPTRSAEQIAHTIDSIGGVLGSSSATDSTLITSIVMKDSLNLGLDLVSDIARNASFFPQEIELQRKQMLSGLTVSYDDPEYLAGVVFDRLVYGVHPYGRVDSGTPQSIAAITRDDLIAYHKAWFGANNAILAIVGDVTTDEAYSGAERAFGSWGKSTRTAERPVDPPAATRRVVVIDRPGAVQTEIRAGHTAVPRKHPDYLALDLALKILGGEGGNRLHRVLRSERGLTYGASADLIALKDAGKIVADTDTRSETTGETLRLLVDETWRLQRQRVSERELNDAQAYLTGSFPLTVETPSAIAMQVLHAVFYGLDLQELQTFRERVNAVTVDDIQRVARTYLHPDRLTIVLVGDASKFRSQLPGAGFDQYEVISVNDLDLNSADLKKKPIAGGRLQPVSYRRTVGEARTQTDDVQSLIERAVRGKGGLAKLQSINTVHVVSDVTLQTQGKTINIPTTIRVAYPGRFRIDSEMPTGPVVQVFDNGTFWIRDPRGTNEAPPGTAEAMRGNIQRDGIALLLALSDGRVKARRAPDVAVDGRPMPSLLVDVKPGGPVTVVLDAQSGRILRTVYPGPGSAGEVEEIFSDYRDVNGLQVAFAVTVKHPQLGSMTRVIRKFDYNAPLDPAIFTKPS
jgi:zinc protease